MIVYLLPYVRPVGAKSHWKHAGPGEPLRPYALAAQPFGELDRGLVFFDAVDVDAHATVSADPESFAFPLAVDEPIGEKSLDAMSSLLESWGVPAHDLNASMTVAAILDNLARKAQAYQASQGEGVSLVNANRGLDDGVQSKATPGERAKLAAAAARMGADAASVLRGEKSMRDVTVELANSWTGPIHCGLGRTLNVLR